MAKNLLDDTFYIHSQYLKLVEPLMIQYFDFDTSMLLDQIKSIVETKCDNYITYKNGVPQIDYLKTFYEDKSLFFIDSAYSHKNGLDKETTYIDLADQFPNYFSNIEDKEAQFENDKVYLSLSYMAYIYFKQNMGDFNRSFLIDALDLEYTIALHKDIYPEMLSLYRMILESKQYKTKGGKVTITNNFYQLNINSHAWFVDDMEKYFANRFPNLTLDKINELLPKPSKAGRKPKDPYLMIMIWGTYQLLKNHHSAFKKSRVKISKEMCQFILDYLKYLDAKHNLSLTDIKDNLKDMLKRGYAPKWNLPWRNVFSDITEKQPESSLAQLNQPIRRYNI